MIKQMSIVNNQKQTTLRNLAIKSNEFENYISDFEKWLRVFGFANSTTYCCRQTGQARL